MINPDSRANRFMAPPSPSRVADADADADADAARG
jgi:hypothetical protein